MEGEGQTLTCFQEGTGRDNQSPRVIANHIAPDHCQLSLLIASLCLKVSARTLFIAAVDSHSPL